MDRRKFVKILGAAGVAGALPLKFNLFRPGKAFGAVTWVSSPALQKFVQALPGLGASGIPVAAPVPDPVFPNTDFYRITAGAYTQVLHPSLPAATHLFGYTDSTAVNFKHLGGLIIATRGRAVRARFTNTLPPTSIMPVDKSIPGAETGQAENRIATHLHGGLVPWISDGGPFDWFTPGGGGYAHGASFLNGPGSVFDNIPGMPMANGQADYYYPNALGASARLEWYHDHALGITRLNAYAGIASGYLIRDNVVAAMENNGTIPPLSRVIPLIFQDKIFLTGANPVAGGRGGAGDLWYPSVYDPAIWTYNPPAGAPPLPVPSAVPEFFGDTMLANGKVFPSVSVNRGTYRLIMLNACNARVLRLKLVFASGAGFPANTEPTTYNNPPAALPFVQIGAEGGFLPAPVTLTGTGSTTTLLLAPAERAELIVDFSKVPANSILLLYNDAPAPFPTADPRNDYYPGGPGVVNPAPGFGPNTRTIMQFNVSSTVLPALTRPLVLPALDPVSLLGKTPKRTRRLTLNEDFDQFGRLIQYLGTNVLDPSTGSFGRPYLEMPPTETPTNGDIEIWEIANLTGDTHPIHFHLVNVQIISRQPFDAGSYNGTPTYTGPARPPDPNERGWKETVRMNPSEVIRVIAKFDLPPGLPFTVATSTRFGPPPAGKKYNDFVWHCHILEHEEHDMMRPLVVISP